MRELAEKDANGWCEDDKSNEVEELKTKLQQSEVEKEKLIKENTRLQNALDEIEAEGWGDDDENNKNNKNNNSEVEELKNQLKTTETTNKKLEEEVTKLKKELEDKESIKIDI